MATGGFYSPRLRRDLVTRLWQVKEATGVPMTQLASDAVAHYLDNGSGPDVSLEEVIEWLTERRMLLALWRNGDRGILAAAHAFGDHRQVHVCWDYHPSAVEAACEVMKELRRREDGMTEVVSELERQTMTVPILA